MGGEEVGIWRRYGEEEAGKVWGGGSREGMGRRKQRRYGEEEAGKVWGGGNREGMGRRRKQGRYGERETEKVWKIIMFLVSAHECSGEMPIKG